MVAIVRLRRTICGGHLTVMIPVMVGTSGVGQRLLGMLGGRSRRT
jgi:hypothetical protein